MEPRAVVRPCRKPPRPLDQSEGVCLNKSMEASMFISSIDTLDALGISLKRNSSADEYAEG